MPIEMKMRAGWNNWQERPARDLATREGHIEVIMLTHLQARVTDCCGVGVRNVVLSQILSRAECTVHRHRFDPHGQPTESGFLRRRILILMNMREIVCPAAKC